MSSTLSSVLRSCTSHLGTKNRLHWVPFCTQRNTHSSPLDCSLVKFATLEKKEPDVQQVNHAVLQHLQADEVEVEIWRADELEMRRGLSSELDEMWSFVKAKTNPRWLWHAIDHGSGKVLAYVFGRRKDSVFLQRQTLLEPFGMTRYYTDGWGLTSGIWMPINIEWARTTRRKSRASTLICGRGSSGWYVAPSVFPRPNRCTIWSLGCS